MKNRGAMMVIALVQAVLGFEWIKAGWEKVNDPHFVGGMAATLGVFAGKNPTGWYKSLLTDVGIPNATFFGWLVAYGELIVGVALVLAAAIYVIYGIYGRRLDVLSRYVAPIGAAIALFGAAFLNANFWFAAGWLSVSTDGMNTIMFLIEVVLAAATIYFVAETERHEREEELAWQQLFKPAPTEQPAATAPQTISR